MSVGIIPLSEPVKVEVNITREQPSSETGSKPWPPIGDTGPIAVAPEPIAELIITLA